MTKVILEIELPEEWDDTIHIFRIDAIDTDEGCLAFDTLPYKIIEPIKAKALRKKGTDEWYVWNNYYSYFEASKEFKIVWGEMINYDLPEDAEIINVEIRIIEP